MTTICVVFTRDEPKPEAFIQSSALNDGGLDKADPGPESSLVLQNQSLIVELCCLSSSLLSTRSISRIRKSDNGTSTSWAALRRQMYRTLQWTPNTPLDAPDAITKKVKVGQAL